MTVKRLINALRKKKQENLVWVKTQIYEAYIWDD